MTDDASRRIKPREFTQKYGPIFLPGIVSHATKSEPTDAPAGDNREPAAETEREDHLEPDPDLQAG